ncbi:MAG: type toxin-antitoxin system VapC family toxin [Acidimicrobiales bacterium]|nr:type toxin-antitoxin system VapC family toxin [Acidimicrobiales bacterium]
MTRGLADTSILVAGESGRALDVARLPDQLAISVVTLGELRAGVLVAEDSSSRARRLETLSRAQALAVIPIDEQVAGAWAELRVRLRDAGRRMPVNDSWIAATAISLRVPVVTQDRDYVQLPGLDVVLL